MMHAKIECYLALDSFPVATFDLISLCMVTMILFWSSLTPRYTNLLPPHALEMLLGNKKAHIVKKILSVETREEGKGSIP